MRPPDIALCGYAGAGKTFIAQHLAEKHGYTRRSFADPLRQLFRAIFGREASKKTDRAALQKLGTDIGRSEKWATVAEAMTVDGGGVVETKRKRRQAQLNAAIQLQIEMVGTRPNHPVTADEWWQRIVDTEKLLYTGETPFAKGFGSRDFWAEKAGDVLAARGPEDGPVVFDDCRFPNEAIIVQGKGGRLVHVEADVDTCGTRILGRDGAFDPAMFEHESEKWHTLMNHDAAVPGIGDVEFNAARLLRSLTDAAAV